MATELYELYKNDEIAFLKKIKAMHVSELLTELDDTIQIDMLKMSNEEWISLEGKRVYQSIINELRKRIV